MYREKELDGLLKWLNNGNGEEGVMGWVNGIYEGGLGGVEGGGGAGEEAKKFLKPTFSRFEYHIHKVLCQLRCVFSKSFSSAFFYCFRS